MRVAVLVDRLIVGGVEKTAVEQVRALRAKGVDSRLLVLKRDRLSGVVAEWVTGIPVEFLDDRLPRLLRTSLRVPGFYFFSVFHLLYAALLPSRVKRREWDVILSHNSYTTFTAWRLSRSRRIPYCMFVWDPIDSVLRRAYTRGPIRALRGALLPIGRAVDRALARGARRVLAGSNSYVDYLEGLLPAGAPGVVVVPPGCRPVETPRAQPGDYVLAATSWKEGKQLEVLLEAIARRPSARLVVAGRWLHKAYRLRMESLAADLNVQQRTDFRGELSEEAMAEVVGAALCSVTLNAERGFGMPPLEAAALSCTFVCPRIAGIAKYFEDGVEAFYFDEGDVAGLAMILERLIANPDVAYEAGLAAWRRARSGLTWEHHGQTVLAALTASADRTAA